MNIDGSNVQMVSNGEGRTTALIFLRAAKRCFTHRPLAANANARRARLFARLRLGDLSGLRHLHRDARRQKHQELTNSPGYDAEATISPNGKKIVFTSERDGDLELYSMDIDGKNVKRLTNEPGYDGGAFYSPDNKMIVYRGSHPTTQKTDQRD